MLQKRDVTSLFQEGKPAADQMLVELFAGTYGHDPILSPMHDMHRHG